MKTWVDQAVRVVEDSLSDVGFVGTYLHGSLASGAYHPPKSDVDLLFVVEHPLDPALKERVSLACIDAAGARPTIGTLELSVLLRRATSAGVWPMPYELHFGEDLVEQILAGTADYGVSGATDDDLAAHIRCLQETGFVLSGPPVDQVFAPVPGPVFRASVEADQDWILEGDHILESPVYGVLNLCRGLWIDRRPGHTSTPSKVEAGRWAVDEVPREVRRVVVDALDAHRDPGWIPPDHRRTAGRVWDVEALLAFRDAMAVILGRRTGRVVDIAPSDPLSGHPTSTLE